MLPGKTILPSTTINAYGAFAQQEEQHLPNTQPALYDRQHQIAELPNIVSKNVNQLQLGNFAFMHHPKTKCMYIGEVLDIYMKGSSSRYGSILTVDGELLQPLSNFS